VISLRATLDAAVLFSLAMWHSAAQGATVDEIMRSRYGRYQACMHRALGIDWRKKHSVPFGMNRWGITEPTADGYRTAPPLVRERDAECRRANELQDAPRPRREYPEKNTPD
jgi:hypothetical protein